MFSLTYTLSITFTRSPLFRFSFLVSHKKYDIRGNLLPSEKKRRKNKSGMRNIKTCYNLTKDPSNTESIQFVFRLHDFSFVFFFFWHFENGFAWNCSSQQHPHRIDKTKSNPIIMDKAYLMSSFRFLFSSRFRKMLSLLAFGFKWNLFLKRRRRR